MAKQAAQKAEQNKFLIFLQWKKMNTKVARQNLSDDELAWAENVQPIAPNDWTVVSAPGANIVSGVLSATSSRMWPASFAGVDYLIVYGVDQSFKAINTTTGAVTTLFGGASGMTDPDVTVWASQRILAIDPILGYITWDGVNTIAFKGTLSPNVNVTAGGSGYTSAPSISFSGGHGAGATATAAVAAGELVSITMNNPGSGYLPGDVITVNIGGPGTGATAIARIMPQVFGNRLDVFSGRVWIASGRLLTFTGTGASTGAVGWDDFNPSDASGNTTILDQDLSHEITAIKNLNNYLYIFGDKSVRQIGTISVSSSVTLFTPLTLASDIGTTFQQTIQSYNRLVLFANVSGVYGIFGASVKKISDDLDGIFESVNFSLALSSGVIDVAAVSTDGGAIHCYALCVNYNDPVANITRTLILVFQSDRWWIANQGNSLSDIVGIFLAATNSFILYACDAAGHVFPCLADPGGVVPVLVRTALSFDKNPLVSKRLVRSGAGVTSNLAQTFEWTVETEQTQDVVVLSAAAIVSWVNNNGINVQWQNNSDLDVNFVGGGYRFPYAEADGEGKVIGATLQASLSSQFSLNAAAFEYVEGAIWGLLS